MSLRLGGALAAHIRRIVSSDSPSFIIIEGVPSSVALGMSRSWSGDLPRLAIVSENPGQFGSHALVDASGTQLRNQEGTNGLVVVLCDGEQIPDRQSLNFFESISPSVLLENAAGMGLLSQQAPAVDLDGSSRSVREAINQADPATRPSATAVATYLDKLAEGADPLSALPALGGFRDQSDFGTRIDSDRIADNLSLASRRTSEDFLKQSAFLELRKNAVRVLSLRASLSNPADAEAEADKVMTLLQSGDSALLETLMFDEAREILERKTIDLPELVKREIANYRKTLDPISQAAGLPWQKYMTLADSLKRANSQKDAARDLCALDDAQQRNVFEPPTRKKLERLLRDRAVSGNAPSSPETAIIKALQQLDGPIVRVQVLAPTITPGAATANRSGAGRILTQACARLRLGGLMRSWSVLGGEIDGLLLRPVDDEDLPGLLSTFADASLSDGSNLPPLQLKLSDAKKHSVQIDWRPDLDDVAMLRTVLVFAEAPALTARVDVEPTLHAFCGANEPRALPVSSVALTTLASSLQRTAELMLADGITPTALNEWVGVWRLACENTESNQSSSEAEELALVGAVRGKDDTVALTFLSPLKSEWMGQHLSALWGLMSPAEREPWIDAEAVVATAVGISRTTATHYPTHIRLRTQDRPLLPTGEGRIWGLYGGTSTRDESGFAGEALTNVVIQLLTLQPEAAGHLRCLAWGPGAADLLTSQAVRLIGKRAGKAVVGRIEIFCVLDGPQSRPSAETLAEADDELRGGREVLQLRYLDSLDQARELLRPTDDAPSVHLALVTGLTEGGQRLQIESPEVEQPVLDTEVLFAPRVWQRPKQDRRTLLMPPAATENARIWLRLQNAVEDTWPEPNGLVRVPEVRTGTLDIAKQLQQVHDLALWVATLDRYATRDSLEQALGRDSVAILHQERRLGGDSPLSLVLSQKSGGPADRAIGRSLRAAGIVKERDIALSIGTDLRKVASQGYGILALQAATSGAGINELVGHVVAFSLLATATTPWPLPAGCRVLLVSLDEYRHWFPGKRADLLAIALDTTEMGVHVAAIEVKARRSDETDAASSALEQLNQTLAATRWAAYPDKSIHTRLWLNRIAEAAYAVARESRFKLDAKELEALESFRKGFGTLEWAGVGLVFGPNITPVSKTFRANVSGDIVPVVIHNIELTEDLLRTATSVSLANLRTAHSEQPPLESSRVRRRPETGVVLPARSELDPALALNSKPQDEMLLAPPGLVPSDASDEILAATSDDMRAGDQPIARSLQFVAPLLGWDALTGEAMYWHPAGPGQVTLQNGHVEVWGSSGMGKTQFTMSLLAQLSHRSGSRFGIADFKNDYSDDSGFPRLADAEFLDLWNVGVPYNPLALENKSSRAIDTAVIELRDAVDEATKSFARMGVKQRAKLERALHLAYDGALLEGRWPTLLTLNDLLDDDLAAILGDLTRHELFKAGQPLGSVVDKNVVFGLSTIPGNGQTTVLAAGFILSSLLLTIQGLPPVPNSIRYVMVVDEAHRVSGFRAIQTMIREGRSKGLAVVLATQQPLDLPDVVAANAQTKICFGLPDATVAAIAARKLQPDNPRLPEQIRTLGVGEAFVSIGGESPRLLKMTQAYRDTELFSDTH